MLKWITLIYRVMLWVLDMIKARANLCDVLGNCFPPLSHSHSYLTKENMINLLENSKRSYLGRTTNLLTPLSYFSRSSIVVHHQEYAGAGPNWVWNSPDFENYTLMVQCYRLPPHTSNTSKYPKWLAKKSFRTRKYTPNDDCVVCALGMSVVSCFNNLWINCVFFIF